MYEGVTGVAVVTINDSDGSIKKEGDNVGNIWKVADGIKEVILDAGDERHHNVVISNEYIRALRVSFSPEVSTWTHRQAEEACTSFWWSMV